MKTVYLEGGEAHGMILDFPDYVEGCSFDIAGITYNATHTYKPSGRVRPDGIEVWVSS